MPQPDYPLPKFHFKVEWGDSDFHMGFTEVSGLDFETEVIEYREGTSPKYNKLKQPGLTKYADVTAKKGTFEGDFKAYSLWKESFFFQEGNKTGSRFRRTVTINLLDEKHQPIVTWVLENAWVKKVQSTDLKADANEVAIETLEFAHEGLTILEAT